MRTTRKSCTICAPKDVLTKQKCDQRFPLCSGGRGRDLNVILDVAQHRLPHYQASEEVLHRARAGEFTAVLPGHALTTLHYIIEKWSEPRSRTRPSTVC